MGSVVLPLTARHPSPTATLRGVTRSGSGREGTDAVTARADGSIRKPNASISTTGISVRARTEEVAGLSTGGGNHVFAREYNDLWSRSAGSATYDDMLDGHRHALR